MMTCTYLSFICLLTHATTNDRFFVDFLLPRLAVASKDGYICIVDINAHTIVYDSLLSVKVAENEEEPDSKDSEICQITSSVTVLKFVRSYPPSSGNNVNECFVYPARLILSL